MKAGRSSAPSTLSRPPKKASNPVPEEGTAGSEKELPAEPNSSAKTNANPLGRKGSHRVTEKDIRTMGRESIAGLIAGMLAKYSKKEVDIDRQNTLYVEIDGLLCIKTLDRLLILHYVYYHPPLILTSFHDFPTLSLDSRPSSSRIGVRHLLSGIRNRLVT